MKELEVLPSDKIINKRKFTIDIPHFQILAIKGKMANSEKDSKLEVCNGYIKCKLSML